jgi:hypothetical protein
LKLQPVESASSATVQERRKTLVVRRNGIVPPGILTCTREDLRI